MNYTKQIKKYFFIIFFIFFFDLIISQFFLLDILEKNQERIHKEDLENRIYNKNYKYTFNKNKTFTSSYYGMPYTIHTNNLGFRDSSVKKLDLSKKYSILIGDSFVEGVAADYEDTIVGVLNNKLGKKIQSFEFLNAGVSSYSSYIYLKKMKTILTENPLLKVKSVVLFMDKSDIKDDLQYLNKPTKFIDTKRKYQNYRKADFKKDLLELNLWRFYSKQTISGSFLKIIGDKIEYFLRDLRDKFKLSKILKKSFFKITKDQTDALRSINNRRFIANYFYGKNWETLGKKSANFSIENLLELKKFLDNKNIEMIVILYPWSFEIVDPIPRNNYVSFMENSLNKNNIKYLNLYSLFLSEEPYLTVSRNFIFNDIHYNSKGNYLIAEYLFGAIN